MALSSNAKTILDYRKNGVEARSFNGLLSATARKNRLGEYGDRLFRGRLLQQIARDEAFRADSKVIIKDGRIVRNPNYLK